MEVMRGQAGNRDIYQWKRNGIVMTSHFSSYREWWDAAEYDGYEVEWVKVNGVRVSNNGEIGVPLPTE